MKNSKILLLSLLSAFLFFASCDEDEVTNLIPNIESTTLATELGEYVNIDPFPAMITAEGVNTAILTSANIAIIDIRSEEAFIAGHITGAVNVAFGDLLTYYEANNLDANTTVAIACYSGQTASYGSSLLRMLGYTNVKALKWGMSSWSDATSSKWLDALSNGKAALMSTEAGTKNAIGSLPVISTGEATGNAILRARVEKMFTDGFGTATITNSDAFTNSNTNYTVNYWKEEHYNVGHIPGAVQYTPKSSLSFTQELLTLPTDKTVVVYCYTGQTSAFMTAYLKVLGYDAKTLLYGANGMMYDVMHDYTGASSFTYFKDSYIMDYTVATK